MFSFTNIQDAAVAIVIAGILILIGALVARLFKTAKQPTEHAVLQLLLPYALKGVYAGETLALQTLDAIHVKLNGFDKKAIADATYALLPKSVSLFGVSFDPKQYISETIWSEFVQQVFSEADAFVHQNESFLHKQVDQMVSEYEIDQQSGNGADPAAAPPNG